MGGREKGSRAELEVARIVNAWWLEVEPCLFVRTPLSGGWGRPEHREGFQSGGDLMTTARRFPFAVEVKRRERWVWANVDRGKASPIWAWWRQSQQAAREMGKHPMMWFRHNREPWLVFIPRELDGRVPAAYRPARIWTKRELGAVDHGGILPVCYWADDLMRAPARVFDTGETT